MTIDMSGGVNCMKLNATILRNLYSTLYCCDPFKRWNLPLPEEIRFIADDDTTTLGTYLHDSGDDQYQHTITISKARCGHIMTVLSTLCHEMIHMSRHKTDKWTHHDAEFRRRAKIVGLELGLDPLEL